MISKSKQRAAILQMVACASLWSIGGIFIKLIDWNPFAIAGIRSLIGAAVIGLYILLTRQRVVISKNMLLSMLFMSSTFFCFVSANKLTTAANAIVLQFTAPVFIMIFSALLFRQKYRLSDMATVFFTLAGMVIFFLSSLREGRILGDVLGVCAGLSMAGMYLAVGKTDDREKMSSMLFGQVLTAVIGIPFCFFTKATFSVTAVTSVVILGVFQLGIPYILLGLATSRCPPLACSLIAAIEPLLNPVWVFLFNGEQPGIWSLVGGVIVIAAVTVQCVLQDKRAAAVPGTKSSVEKT